MSPAGRILARTFRGTPRNLAFLAKRLRAGDVVAVPTETVYGLAANALDPKACAKVFRAKRRPTTDPLIVHLRSARLLASVAEPNPAAERLADAFWPGPLTLVLPKRPHISGIVTAGRDSVAVRVPAHPLFRRLLNAADLALAAPSANPFGYVSPTTARHVRDGLGTRIRYILDGGPAKIGVESTIVDVRDPRRPRLLRPGAITRQQLERVLGCPVEVVQRASGTGERPQLAPGMLTRHYSPKTRVILHEVLPPIPRRGSGDEAYVHFRRPAGRVGRNVFWLDERGDLRRAARRLFGVLRKVDAAGYRRMHVELAPGDGIADAINDRLRRAAAR